jgi:hypothetical protein
LPTDLTDTPTAARPAWSGRGGRRDRYARRRANQAGDATDRAADIAGRILLPDAPGVPADPDEAVNALVCGGNRSMIDAVLTDRRLAPLGLLRHPRLLETAEPGWPYWRMRRSPPAGSASICCRNTVARCAWRSPQSTPSDLRGGPTSRTVTSRVLADQPARPG